MRTRLVLLWAALVLAPGPAGAREPITIAYVEWSSSVVSAHLMQYLLQEEARIPCRLLRTSAEGMWRAVADGEADAMLSAWLPGTHAHYRETYGDRVEDLGPNLEGTRIGLVVPEVTSGRFTAGTGLRNRPYMDIDSIEDLPAHREDLRGRIIGIDPGAGIMRKTREAMEVYSLDGFRLIEGSEVSMVAELTHAIQRQRWIVVTGWVPHWAFARWSLKFLDDPEGVYGEGGRIATLVREGLADDAPVARGILDRFHWSPEEMGQLMLWNQDDGGRFPLEKARRWARAHPERVRAWLGED